MNCREPRSWWFVLAVFVGCASGAAPRTPKASTVDAAIVKALSTSGATRETAIARAIELVERREATTRKSTGLGPALRLLAATTRPERDARIEALERLAEQGDDAVVSRLADAQLERDPLWLANELDSDSIYSDAAAFLNGVTQTFAAAIQGNPIGTLQPLVVGIEGALNGLPLDPRDRARLALERRLRIDGAFDAAPESLQRRISVLHDQTCREELRLARDARDRGDFTAALAHVGVADLLAVRDDEVESVRESIVIAADARARSITAALEVRIEETEAPDPPRKAATAFARVVAERDALRAATWRYVFTGQREELDPLRRHVAARRAETRSWLDVLAPVIWLPATIVRGVYAGVGNPVDDRRVIDAEARFVREDGEHPDRAVVLRDLAVRHERRGETWKAILALREAGAPADEIARLESKLVDELLDGEVDPDVRRRRLEWIAVAFEGTTHQAVALEELAKPVPNGSRGRAVPIRVALAACAKVSPLGVDARFVNEDERDGEIDPPRLRVAGARAYADVTEEGGRRELVLELDTVQAARLNALAVEWEWRFAAARTETYRLEHDGVPVELYAGFGANGIAVYPRLLPEDYSRRDARLYE